MRKIRVVPLLNVLSVALLLFCFVGQGLALSEDLDTPPDDKTMGHGDAAEIIVARVNGIEINMAALMERMLDIVEKRYGRREITSILAEEIKQESIEQLVMAEIVYQAASRVVTVSPDEINKVVAERIKSFGGDDVFEKYMQAKQLKNKAEFAEKMRRVLVVHKYITEKIEPKIEISDEMIAAAYRGAAGAYFNRPEVVQVTKIVFFLDPTSSESYEKIRQLRNKIINELGADPTQLAVDGTFIVQESIKLSPTANKKLYEVAKKLDNFGISDVVESNGTLHLLQSTGFQSEVSKTLEEVSGYLRNEIFDRMKKTMVNEWMAKLRQGADVEMISVTQ